MANDEKTNADGVLFSYYTQQHPPSAVVALLLGYVSKLALLFEDCFLRRQISSYERCMESSQVIS